MTMKPSLIILDEMFGDDRIVAVQTQGAEARDDYPDWCVTVLKNGHPIWWMWSHETHNAVNDTPPEVHTPAACTFDELNSLIRSKVVT